MRSAVISRIAVLMLVLFLLSSAAVLLLFRPGKVVSFYVNNFTQYRISYEAWRGRALGKSVVRGFTVKSVDKGFSASAREADLDIRVTDAAGTRQVEFSCEMRKVVLMSAPSDKVSEDNAGGNVIMMPFGPVQEYRDVSFVLTLCEDLMRVAEFRADSDKIRMRGDYLLDRKTNEVDIDLKISFSPAASAMFPEDIRNNVLAREDDGWYSTVISYKGNPLLLKALYTLTQ